MPSLIVLYVLEVVFDCQAEVAEDSTIEDFYDLFDSEKKDANAKVLKLKDWPGNTEFKAHCPTLYDDFMQSLPVPDYTRRDGVTNISAFVSRTARRRSTSFTTDLVPHSFRSTLPLLTSVRSCIVLWSVRPWQSVLMLTDNMWDAAG